MWWKVAALRLWIEEDGPRTAERGKGREEARGEANRWARSR